MRVPPETKASNDGRKGVKFQAHDAIVGQGKYIMQWSVCKLDKSIKSENGCLNLITITSDSQLRFKKCKFHLWCSKFYSKLATIA